MAALMVLRPNDFSGPCPASKPNRRNNEHRQIPLRVSLRGDRQEADQHHLEEARECIKETQVVAGLYIDNTIEVQWGGVDHLFESGAEAAEAFESWRREPCDHIALKLAGIEQAGERLPVGTIPGDGCGLDISWDGELDSHDEPMGPAEWPVRLNRIARRSAEFAKKWGRL